tara:strand:- start:452 stop:1060 length:609 start_codon:yes stop_codon:yes gene_type:complete
MRIVYVEQGSEEWHAARMGVPTASQFAKILASTGKPSTRAESYRHTLLAERLGVRAESYESDAMKRGTELEPEARETYEFITGSAVEQVGFVLRGGDLVGCSPDGLIGDSGGLEIKCPMPATHISYLLRGKVPAKYIPQVQGCMYVCGPGRKWWDFMSYSPGLEPLIVRVERDEDYIAALDSALAGFLEQMESDYLKLTKEL